MSLTPAMMHSERMLEVIKELEAERDRLKAEMSGWSKSAMAHFDYNATLVATLQYLRTQAKNGTLHQQVVIQNVDKALGGDAS